MKQIFTLFMLIASVGTNAQNKAGMLDSSFGNNGISITGFTGIPKCNDIALMPDGSFVAAGAISSTTKDSGMCVFKYTHDGLLDKSFGNNGITLIPFDYDGREARAVAVQPDGKIVVTGYIAKGLFPTIYEIPVVRVNANGSLDSSFGTNGIIIANYNNDDFGSDVTIQPDGKILIEGASKGSFITLRYLTDGTLDKSFGDKGKVITSFSGLAAGKATVVQQDGKIIAAGSEDQSVALVRYMPDGSLDNSFGINGKVSSHFNQFNNWATDVVLQDDGKIIIAGNTESFKPDSALVARYKSNGVLDSSFGKNGFTIDEAKHGSDASELALESDGKIIIGGSIGGGYFDTTSFLTARFTVDGTIDSSFGINGNVITNILAGSYASGMVIQEDDKIVLGGGAGDDFGNDYIALARYSNDTESKKQHIITKIHRWIQHHNGFTWDANNSISNYVVQRGYDGINFNSITRIHAGNSSNYTYQDPTQPSGTNYYRLQTTSVNGAVNYSNVIAVTNDNIKISPNPANNSLHIEGLSSNTKLTVVDFSGNIKMQTIVNNTSCNLNIASLKAGNYVLKIETDEGAITKKFLKQ